MAKPTGKTRVVPLVALVLAWLIPGAGHFYLGRYVRGIILFVTISATFWSGVAMGGVLTADYYNERWWFVAEMFTGAYGLYSWRRQKQTYDEMMFDDQPNERLDPPRPGPGGTVSLAQMKMDEKLAAEGLALVPPTDTVARAYAGTAGLLNLMCIFDAVALSLMGVKGEPPGHRRRRDEEEGRQ